MTTLYDRQITLCTEVSRSGLTVSLASVKRKLRVEHGYLDQTILEAIETAVRWAEDQCYRTLSPVVTYQETLSQWPGGYYGHEYGWSTLPRGSRLIALSRPPLASVESVKYYDTANAQQTVSTANYRVLTPTMGRGYVELDNDYNLPCVYDRTDAIQVNFTAGWATRTAIPPQIREAVKFYAAYLLDGNESDEQAAVRMLDNTAWGMYG